MWRRWLAALVTGVLLGSLVMVPAAQAGEQDDPLWGDLNGDRRLDRITLGGTSDGRCAVHVQWSATGAVEEHPYVPPGAQLPLDFCPDLGVAVDLGGNGSVELVVGSWNGAPTGAQGSIFVLRDFVPEVLERNDIQLNEIGTADFNGDGRTDVYWWSDQGGGFTTHLNGTDGRLVPGPLQLWSGEVGYYQVVDFDGNGAMDLVVSFGVGAEPVYEGLVVIFDDGAKAWLHQNDDTWSTVDVADLNSDGRLDVRTGATSVFLNRGDHTFVSGPLANDDLAYAYRAAAKVIKVRDNDLASPGAALTIVVPPKYGFLTRHDPRYEVVYQRTASHKLPDTFVYRLSQDGLTDIGTVTVKMKD